MCFSDWSARPMATSTTDDGGVFGGRHGTTGGVIECRALLRFNTGATLNMSLTRRGLASDVAVAVHRITAA